MKTLYRFHWNCGRMGDLDGVFIAEPAEIEALIGKRIYFGEVLGKHSEIEGLLEADDVHALTDDQEFIDKLAGFFGGNTNISGFNPLRYYEPEE